MWKALFDRAVYAVIAAVAGALFGALLWWLYGFGASVRQPTIRLGEPEHLSNWMKASAAFFGLAGFVIKDKAGDLIGELVNQIFRFESGSDATSEVSTRYVVVVLVIVILGVWYFARP